MRFQFNVDEVMKHLRSKILGQEAAMNAIENMLKIIKADISDQDKPLYIAMFLGPTGVGKTETVKVLAEAIHGNRQAYCRVDMNTLSLDHYAAALTGSPPGYVGSKEGLTILDKEKIEGMFSRPGIILFDEIEKASPQVIQTLLNIFDNGMLTMASGEQRIDFRNTLIFMTGNIGAREIYQFIDKKIEFLIKRVIRYINPSNWADGSGMLLAKSIIKREIEKYFSPEFLNRIQDVIVFNWLETDTLNKLVDLIMERINGRLEKYNCQLQLEKSARTFLIEKGFDKHYGGRALQRVIRQFIEAPLSELLTEQSTDEGFINYLGKADQSRIVLTRIEQ